MKTVMLMSALVLVVMTSGCATVRTPALGLFFTDVQSGEAVTAANLGSKKGEACAQSILGLVATGDASIATAARNGGIKTISHVDEYANTILGVVGKYCTRVYGN